MNESSLLLMPEMTQCESCRSVILFLGCAIFVRLCATASGAKLATWDSIDRFCQSDEL